MTALEGVKVKTGNRRKRVLKPDELKRTWAATETQGYPYGTIVQLLAATGQRRGAGIGVLGQRQFAKHLADALLPLSLIAPIAFLLCLAIRS